MYGKNYVARDTFKKRYKYHPYRKSDNTKLKVISMVSVPIFLLGAAGLIAKKSDEKVDHTNSICWFTDTCHNLGLEIGKDHQLAMIKKAGYDAYYQSEKVSKYYRHSTILTVQDGYYIHQEKIIPDGYEPLDKPHDGYDCYKEVNDPEAFVVVDNNGQTVRKLTLNSKK